MARTADQAEDRLMAWGIGTRVAKSCKISVQVPMHRPTANFMQLRMDFDGNLRGSVVPAAVPCTLAESLLAQEALEER